MAWDLKRLALLGPILARSCDVTAWFPAMFVPCKFLASAPPSQANAARHAVAPLKSSTPGAGTHAGAE